MRGKSPDDKILDLAREKGIVILTTEERMYEACGRLYQLFQNA
ncbi:hypothetical protein FACS1894120_5880 [Clostridia bacterium]|nr:hypothetical protein FACS1894120_5880 [Clostridia bacterium]